MSNGSQFVPGMIFGKDFQVVSKLAAGGMGTVYVALQLSTGKQRALKVMHSQYEGDSKARQRFIQEARAGASIDSDHIVETVGAGIDEETGSPWLAMELLKGQDLKQTLAERGALGPDEVLEIFRQMCHALAAAHAVGLVHRDLKPENIFLAVPRREGIPFTVKILDFGIAKLVAESTVSSNHTQAVGSPRWMAPEQAERGGEIRPSTDVWALGLIAFQLFTGIVYWKTANTEKPSVMQQMCEVLMDPIEPPSLRAEYYDRPGTIPPGFDGWFARCVNRDQDMRFQDASEAMAAFNEIFAAWGVGPMVSSPLRGPTMNRRGASIAPGANTTGSNPSQRKFQTNPQATGRAPTPARGSPLHSGSNPDLRVASAPRVGRPTPGQLPTYGSMQGQEGVDAAMPPEPSRPVSQPSLMPRRDDAYDLGDTTTGASVMEVPMPQGGPQPAATPGKSPATLVGIALAGIAAVGLLVFGVVSYTQRTTQTPVAPPPAVVDAAPPQQPVVVATPDVPGTPVANLPAVDDDASAPPLIPPEVLPNGHNPAHNGHGNNNTAVNNPPTPVNPVRADAGAAPTTAPELNGALREQVSDLVHHHSREITRCYDTAARSNPELAGRLEANFVLAPNGHVSSTTTHGLESAPDVGICVAAILEGITFPTSTGGPQLFSFTFQFQRAAPQTPPPTPPPAQPETPPPAPTPPPAADPPAGT